MNNDNLHNALIRLGASYEPGADLTANIMKRVNRRARQQRIINIAIIVLFALVIISLTYYFIVPIIAPIITIVCNISFTRLIPICGIFAIICLLLVADSVFRKKYMPTTQSFDKSGERKLI